jgi:hypothetical protein
MMVKQESKKEQTPALPVKMSASTTAPRVNSTLLPTYIGRTVTLVGRRTGGSASMVHLEAPDGGDVVVDRGSSSRPWGSNFVEVVGIVNPDRSIREARSTDFGNDFGG